MKLLFVIREKENETILDELKKTTCIDEVIKVLSGIKNRGFFIEIINELLNELADERNKRLNMERKRKKDEEVEVL